MKKYRVYFLSATIWLSLAFLAVACGNKGGNGNNGIVCANGLCSSPGNYGGTPGSAPYPSQYNGVISNSSAFSSINLSLNPSYSSYGCYGSFPLLGYAGPSAPNQGQQTYMTYGCNNIQVAVALTSATPNADGSVPAVLYMTSPSVSANPYQAAQLAFTSLNANLNTPPYTAFSIAAVSDNSNMWAKWFSVTGGYILQVDSQVCNYSTCQIVPRIELDISGSTSNPTMTYQLYYLSNANQTLAASGTMIKGVDYQ